MGPGTGAGDGGGAGVGAAAGVGDGGRSRVCSDGEKVRRREKTGSGATDRPAAAFLAAARTSGECSGDGEVGGRRVAARWWERLRPSHPWGATHGCACLLLQLGPREI